MTVVTETPLDVDKIHEVISKVVDVVENDEHLIVIAALLTMVIMATYPHLEGDALIEAVETASQLLLTLAPMGQPN